MLISYYLTLWIIIYLHYREFFEPKSAKKPQPTPDPFYAAIGRRIESARKLGGDTLKTAAQKTGVTHQKMWKVEHGPSSLNLRQLYHFGSAYKVPMESFFPKLGSVEDYMEFFPGTFRDSAEVDALLKQQTLQIPTDTMMYLAARIHCLNCHVPKLDKLLHGILDDLEATGVAASCQ